MQYLTASRLLGLTLCLCAVKTALAQQEWVEGLRQQVFGTTFSARQDNTTRLIQGYYEDPFPQAKPPAAVVVARGKSRDSQDWLLPWTIRGQLPQSVLFQAIRMSYLR